MRKAVAFAGIAALTSALMSTPGDAKDKKPPMMMPSPTPMAAPMMRPPPPPPPMPMSWQLKEQAVLISGSISTSDYPSASLNNFEEGVARATVNIGADGKVNYCTAFGATPILNEETCVIIKRRFRFKPAIARDGKPTSSTKTQPVTWLLDGLDEDGDAYVRTAKKFANAYKVKIDLEVDTKGKVSACQTRDGPSDAERDAFLCGLAKDQWTFAIERDDKNNPIVSKRTFAPDLPLPPKSVEKPADTPAVPAASVPPKPKD